MIERRWSLCAVLLLAGCRSSNEGRGTPSASAPASTSSPPPSASPAPEVPRWQTFWAQGFAVQGKGSVKILALATGRDDALYLAGALSGPVDFGGGLLVGRGLNNAFVAKLDASGNHVWSKLFPGEGSQVASAIAVDAAGNVVVAGTLDRVADFGGGPLRSAGQTDLFVVSLDADGKHRWSKRFGDDEEQEAGGVAVAPDGSVILAGSFEGTLDLGGGPLRSAGGDDVFVARLDASGKHLWSKRFGDPHAQHGRAVAVDPSGNVVLAGDAQGTLDFPLPVGPSQKTPDATSLFVARLDPGGRLLSASRFDATPRSVALPHALAIDKSGATFVAGALRGTTDFGGGPLSSAGDGEPDAFLLALDAAGKHLWSKRFGDTRSQEALALALDPSGRPVIAGRFEGTLDLGGGPLESAGRDDAFVARFDPSGAHVSSARFGDPEQQEATAVATDRTGNVTLAGTLRGTVDLHMGVGLGPVRGPAGFLVKLGH